MANSEATKNALARTIRAASRRAVLGFHIPLEYSQEAGLGQFGALRAIK
jgi:hypothetical protein